LPDSTMRTARPTTGSPLSVLEVGTAPLDPVSPCFCFFGRRDPADPFIPRERRNVLPRRQRLGVGDQCLFQVRGEIVDHPARDRFFAQSFARKSVAPAKSNITSHPFVAGIERDGDVLRRRSAPLRYWPAGREPDGSPFNCAMTSSISSSDSDGSGICVPGAKPCVSLRKARRFSAVQTAFLLRSAVE
jgi:hypothetical protein